jgi:hypothetical protein
MGLKVDLLHHILAYLLEVATSENGVKVFKGIEASAFAFCFFAYALLCTSL